MIAVLVNRLVERPRHAAMVKGFNRYAALTMTLWKQSFSLEDVKNLVETASLDSAMASRAWAFRRSIRVYIAPIAVLVKAESGSIENSGSRIGAWKLDVSAVLRKDVNLVRPDERCHHRKGRHCACRGRGPPALDSH